MLKVKVSLDKSTKYGMFVGSIISALFLVFSVVNMRIGQLSAYSFPGPGQENDPNTFHKQLQWVYNSDTSPAHGYGAVVEWNTAGAFPGTAITTSTAWADVMVAGVVEAAGVAGSSISALSWGWIQTHGWHNAIWVDSRTVNGAPLVQTINVANAAYYTAVSSVATVGGALVANSLTQNDIITLQGVFAYAGETTTTSGTARGYIIK